jgi:hypothetical protein
MQTQAWCCQRGGSGNQRRRDRESKKRAEPKEQCHAPEDAAGKLREMARLKVVLQAKMQAVKDRFRQQRRGEEPVIEEIKKVGVTVYLEDPGGHTHQRAIRLSSTRRKQDQSISFGRS